MARSWAEVKAHEMVHLHGMIITEDRHTVVLRAIRETLEKCADIVDEADIQDGCDYGSDATHGARVASIRIRALLRETEGPRG